VLTAVGGSYSRCHALAGIKEAEAIQRAIGAWTFGEGGRRSGMTKQICKALVALIGATMCCHAFPASGQQSEQRYSFVREYVRQLGDLEHVRETAEREQKEGPDQMVSCVGNSERFQLALREYIRALQRFSFGPPFGDIVSGIIQFYSQKIDVWQKLSQGCAALLSPRPGVDYGQLTAEVPRLRAQLEYIDKALFEITPAVFAMLLDIDNPDSQNHVSYLLITRSQRDQLVSSLQTSFGNKLAQKDQNYTVGTASVLEGYLTKKGYKCSDER
jgi:hypothetical protein